jgi:hypothetical protein
LVSDPWERTWAEVFENRVLRRIFGHKRPEVTGEWRRLRHEELYDLYSRSVFRLSIQEEWDGWGM